MSRYFERLAVRAAAGPPGRPAVREVLALERESEAIAAAPGAIAPAPLASVPSAAATVVRETPAPREYAAKPEAAAHVPAHSPAVTNVRTDGRATRPQEPIVQHVAALAPILAPQRSAAVEATPTVPMPQTPVPATARRTEQPAPGPVTEATREAAPPPAARAALTPIIEQGIERRVATPARAEPLPTAAGPPDRPAEPRRMPPRPATPRVDVRIGTLSVSVHTPPASAAPAPSAAAPARNDHRPAFSASRHYLRAG